jgi:hypothetical protein
MSGGGAVAIIWFSDADRQRMQEAQRLADLFAEFMDSRPFRVAEKIPLTAAVERCMSLRDIRYRP